MKYGTIHKTNPTNTKTYISTTKYGNMNNDTPTSLGTIACCLLPYVKYPNPTTPNIIPKTIDDILYNYLIN